MNRKVDVAAIVGDERAKELERYAMDYYKVPVLGQDQKPEFVGPSFVPAAFECAYCGKPFIANMMEWRGECPRCTGAPTIEAVVDAINATSAALQPPHLPAHDNLFVHTGTISGTAIGIQQLDAAYLGITGSVAGLGNDVYLIPEDEQLCRIDNTMRAEGDTGLCKYHGGGSMYYGRPITSDNYRQIEKDEGASIDAILRRTTLQNWRPT